jgi:ABC-type branched-subunit amino acid transport system ATPase component/predicted MFS family arabinose efflux permease
MVGEPHGESSKAAALAAAVLDENTGRPATEPVHVDVEIDDASLPGVGDESMSVRDALRVGGTSMVVLIGLAQFVEWIDRSAFNVLAPDIQKTLGVSDAVLGAIGGAFGVLFFAGSIPISTLADRRSRTKLAAIAITVWSVMVACTGLVQNAFQLFLARLGSGLGQSYQLPVNSPLLIDTYPIQARARVFALSSGMQMVGQGLAPFIAGSIAAVVGGGDAWRVVFLVTAVAALPVAALTARLHDPKRGRNEMQAVLGQELDPDADEIPISLGVAFERLRRIRTFHFFLLGMAALGFALFSVPLFLNLLLEDRFGLDAFERGLFAALVAIPGVIAVGFVGRRIDRLFRESPPRSLVFIGTLIAAFGVFIALGVFMPDVVLVGVFVAIGTALSASVFGVIVAPLSAVIPYRLRSRGVALVGIYIFLFGGFFGAVITGLLSEEIGTRGAIALVVVPSALIGGALIAYGARHIRGDMAAVVEELEEESEEMRRVADTTGDTPVIQVHNLDFSYGKVQVLFDIDLEVRRGETLALLGTNGAGKSTLLRVVSGLGVAQRGVVRFNGRTVTYADPELRVKIGIVQLMGGKAVFPPLSVAENLRMAGYLYSGDDLRRRVERVLTQFPVLAERRHTRAGDLSGGQQQILALAMTLIHEPEVLIIDELSLGLAPVIIQELLTVVERLKAEGLTMIIVEQSLNVALAVADRAVFMEKGQVRFEGSARELMERDDLARAVFLGP